MLRKKHAPLLVLLTTVALGACTPAQLDTLGVFDPDARATLSELPDVPVSQQDGSILELDGTVTPAAVAERMPGVGTEEAPAPGRTSGSSASSNGRCVGWEGLLAAESPGWDVAQMSRIMYRESRCNPGARNRSSSATGLLQVLSSHCPWLAGKLGGCSRDRLTDPVYNVRAAAALWRNGGSNHWAQTR